MQGGTPEWRTNFQREATTRNSKKGSKPVYGNSGPDCVVHPPFKISGSAPVDPSRFATSLFFAAVRQLTLDQDQAQDSLLVKRRKDNHSPGPVIRELVPSSHQRSELSNTTLCIFSR